MPQDAFLTAYPDVEYKLEKGRFVSSSQVDQGLEQEQSPVYLHVPDVWYILNIQKIFWNEDSFIPNEVEFFFSFFTPSSEHADLAFHLSQAA